MTTTEIFDWCEFYNFANNLAESQNPYELRIGISRFYYAAFCKCRDFLINNGYDLGQKSYTNLTSGTSEVHSEVVNIFCNHKKLNQNREGKKIARNLSRARKVRNKADYDSANYKFTHDYKAIKSQVDIIFKKLNEL